MIQSIENEILKGCPRAAFFIALCVNVHNIRLRYFVSLMHFCTVKTFGKIILFFSNRYLLSIAAFVVWIIFFDENNMFIQRQRTQELNELNSKVEYYRQQVAETRQELKDLQNDPVVLEKYAREKYFMKRDNEEVFIFDSSSLQ